MGLRPGPPLRDRYKSIDNHTVNNFTFQPLYLLHAHAHTHAHYCLIMGSEPNSAQICPALVNST